MEEASVAGESPDKSEQQKSSGTTRSDADPRLAVFREPASPAEPGDGADTATAVFRTPRPEAAAEGAADAEGTAAEAAGAEAGASASGEAGVSASDEAREPEGEPEAVTSPEPQPTLAAEGAAEASEGPESPAGPSEAAQDAAEAPEEPVEPVGADVEPAEEPAASVGEHAESAEPAVEPAAPAAEPAEPAGERAESVEPDGEPAESVAEPSAEPEPEPEPEPEQGDARLRAAVAAWVSKDGDASDAPAPGAEPAPEAGAGAAADAVPDADAGAAGDPAPESHDDDAAGAEADDAAASEPEPEEADETPGADEATAASAGLDDAGSDDAGSDDAGSDDEADDREADNRDTASGTASEARVPRSREESGDEAQPAGDTRGIDQATAVFKAPKLPRVDQPTTALKITRPPAKPETGSRPEAPAERTSKFVPLRADDVRPAPAPRAPERPAAGSAGQQPPAVSLGEAERTRQQPMPPRPPLDLLAELTNTPPPPETPVRTAVRRVKIWTPLVLLLLIVFAIVQMVRPLPTPALTMTAEPAYTFKGGDLNLSWPEQGQSAVTVDGVGSLGSAGAQKPAPIASVAKIMTAYVVLKEHPLSGKETGEKITVDQQAEDESKLGDESTAPISKGQQFTEKQLLQLLMIPSGNNAARLFARWDSSESEFIAKMNAAAKDLGMNDTTYTDPSGLKKTTVSTATDQLKLAKAVMQNEILREIVDTPEIKIDGIDGTIYNNNTILLKPGVSGIKTGSSTPAGGNLVWSANTVVDGKKLWIYGAVMGQQAGTGQPYDSLLMSLNNSLKLIQDAQKAVTSATVVKKGDVVGYVDDGFGGRTPLVATGDLKAKGWAGLKVRLSVQGNGKEITRSMTAGTKVGVVTVGTGPGKVSAPVALQQDLKDPDFGQKLTRIN
ncbi:D-alanyl-D-alanine carboxypeptidase [Streptomyces sp. A0642]|nr:D-alanyl-D-alanine carboxypeptidase [Streptomyces sp. A0642]